MKRRHINAMECLSVSEAALKFGVSESRVYQWIADGRLESIALGSRHIVPGDAKRPDRRPPGRPKKALTLPN